MYWILENIQYLALKRNINRQVFVKSEELKECTVKYMPYFVSVENAVDCLFVNKLTRTVIKYFDDLNLRLLDARAFC